MSKPYRLIVWDQTRQSILGQFTLHAQGETLIGRHRDNHFVIDHADLSQFHLVTRADGESLELHCVPGAQPLHSLKRLSTFIQYIQEHFKGPPLKRVLTQGHTSFRLSHLVFEFLGPQAICKRTWPRTIDLGLEKLPKQRKDLLQNQSTAMNRLLGVLCCCLCLAWYMESRRKPEPLISPEPKFLLSPIPTPTLPVIPPQPITTTNFSGIELEQTKTRVVSVSHSLQENAKRDFIKGKEEEALHALISAYQIAPFSSLGMRLAELAKQLDILRTNRWGNIRAKGSWEPLLQNEKIILGTVSQLTLEQALSFWSEDAMTAFEKKDFKRARTLWENCLTWKFDDAKARSGLHQLDLEGERNFRQAYVLEALEPIKAKEIFARTLDFTPASNPLYAKILRHLQKPSAEMKTLP